MNTYECPACHSDENKVVNSRVRKNGYVSRHRECLKCGRQWSTIEIPGSGPRKPDPPGTKTSQCPKCGGQSKVTNSRNSASRKNDGYIIRRRECIECGTRWSTFELSEANPILIDLPAISSDVQFPVNISELYGLIVGLCPMNQKCVSDIFACISASLNAYTKFKTKKIVPQVTVNGIIASSLLYFSMDAFIAFTLRYIFSPRKSIFEFATFLSEYAEKCSKSYTYLLMSDNATVVQKKKAARIIGALSKNGDDQYSDPDDDDDEDRNDEDALNFDDSDIGEEQKH